MGLAVATKLAATGTWNIVILDRNEEAGKAAASSLKSTTFIPTDVSDYTSLSRAFHQSFTTHNQQLDFVFANAGIVESANFYDTGSAQATGAGESPFSPPPPPSLLTIDINLKSVVTTTWLAEHYFRLNTHHGGENLIMTASVNSLYALPRSPIYAAAKHGVLGFMRSIAKYMFQKDGIRVNAICPGAVRTNLLPQQFWDQSTAQFTPIERIVDAVDLILADEGMWGQTLEVSGPTGLWFRKQVEYADPEIKNLLEREWMA